MVSTTYHYLHPEEAQFPTTNFPQFIRVAGTSVAFGSLKYDATTDEEAFWKLIAHEYTTGNLTLEIWWYADTASTASVVWEASIAALTADADSEDIEAKSLASVNYVQDTHLGTTGQRLHHAVITLTNLDSLSSDDLVFLRIARDADSTNATDDMAGDAILVMARLSYASL